MHPMLNVAVKAARAAGRVITRASVDIDTVRVASKQRNDLSPIHLSEPTRPY